MIRSKEITSQAINKFRFKKPTQPCPQCNFPIGVVAGSKEAICKNCGFKDPCCE